MKMKILLLSLLMIFCCASSAMACTGFALYGNQIFYGMNFDYFSVPLKFLIESRGGMNVFHLSFLYEKTVDDPRFKGYFARTCGMNDKGLFCSCQEVEPYIEGGETLGDDEIRIDDHYDAISAHPDVNHVKRIISGKRWVQNIGPSLHNLFADSSGHAMVTETDNRENVITEMRDDFIVMTNFANCSLAGRSYKDAEGVGADRYQTAHEYLSGNKSTFSVDKGFHLLQRVALNDPDCLTLCSMVFLPEANQVYISMNRDFGKIWKLSLDERTIATHRGHQKLSQMCLGPEGILSTELELLGWG